MTVANDFSWVLCTPSKTGSTSLATTLINRLGVAHREGSQHSTICHHTGAQRIMVVRNPFDRWASMYSFCKAKRPKAYLSEFTSNINLFANEWIKQIDNIKRNTYWTDNLSVQAMEFDPQHVFRLEDGLQNVIDHLGYDIKVSKTNTTTPSFKQSWVECAKQLNRQNLNFIRGYLQADKINFNYKEPK